MGARDEVRAFVGGPDALRDLVALRFDDRVCPAISLQKRRSADYELKFDVAARAECATHWF